MTPRNVVTSLLLHALLIFGVLGAHWVSHRLERIEATHPKGRARTTFEVGVISSFTPINASKRPIVSRASQASHDAVLEHKKGTDPGDSPHNDALHEKEESLHQGQGSVEGKDTVLARYLAQVVSLLERGKRYPKSALLQEQEGTVVLIVDIAGDGTKLSAHVLKSSGVAALDQEALRQINEIVSFPVLPAEISPPLHLHVPIRYVLKAALRSPE